MMDKSAVEAIVDKWLPIYQKMFGLDHYKIKVYYQHCGSDTEGWSNAATYDANPAYNLANLWLDPHQQDDEEDVLDSLRHELFHVVLDPYWAYRRIVNAGGEDQAREKEVWRFFSEQAVVRLQNLFKGTREHFDKRTPIGNIDQSTPTPGGQTGGLSIDQNRGI